MELVSENGNEEAFIPARNTFHEVPRRRSREIEKLGQT